MRWQKISRSSRLTPFVKGQCGSAMWAPYGFRHPIFPDVKNDRASNLRKHRSRCWKHGLVHAFDAHVFTQPGSLRPAITRVNDFPVFDFVWHSLTRLDIANLSNLVNPCFSRAQKRARRSFGTRFQPFRSWCPFHSIGLLNFLICFFSAAILRTHNWFACSTAASRVVCQNGL